MSRRLLFRIVAILLPISMLAVVAELVLRHRARSVVGANGLVHRSAADATLIYEFAPNARVEFGGVEFAINSAGFRDDEFQDGLPGGRRIVVVGDSVAVGWGLAMTSAFPQVLERELSDTVVYNLSVDGYSTGQELRVLESTGLALEPDLVVVSYTLNDPDESDGGLARHYGSRIELWHLLGRGLHSLIESMQDVPNEYHQRIHMRHAAMTEAHFRRLGGVAESRKIPIVVAITPVFGGSLGDDYAWSNIHDRLAELCRANGLLCLDLRTALAAAHDSAVAFDVWHPSAYGHRVIAKALARFVEDQR